MYSQSVLVVPPARVVGVNVDGLGERALDHSPGAADELLELGRQHYRLLLVCTQLADYWET